MRRSVCPICSKQVAHPADAEGTFPFCSRRCRLVDLGNWLGEGYRLPDDGPPDLDGLEGLEDSIP